MTLHAGWTHVRDSADEALGLMILLQFFSYPEVGQLDSSVDIDQQVGGFDVAMHDSAVVQNGQGLEGREHNDADIIHSELFPFLQQRLEGPGIHVFEGQTYPAKVAIYDLQGRGGKGSDAKSREMVL